MGVISVKYDNKLEQSKVVFRLLGSDGLYSFGIDQTNVYGILVPIISVSGTVFKYDEIIRMNLYNDGKLPYLDLVLNDRKKQLININNQINDNEIRVQILPIHGDTYKKIDLTFYIDTIEINENKVYLSATYKLPELYKSRLSSFGQMNSYEMFDKIASDCKLGFATNCEPNDEDKRYIYCNNISYETLMNREINTSGSINNVYDYWIDLWNNINFVNMTSRYNDVDKEEDMLVWVNNSTGVDPSIFSLNSQKPVKVVATITNLPISSGELSTNKYKLINNIGVNQRKGTDKVHTIYKNGNVIDVLIEDSNPVNDIFTKYEYLGENIGEYEYLTAKSYRESFMDMINKNNIEVELDYPCLGLSRGSHVYFEWWDNSSIIKQSIKELGGDLTDNTKDQTEDLEHEFKLIRNKQISGEYLILKTVLTYKKGNWKNKLILTRPIENIKTYIKQDE